MHKTQIQMLLQYRAENKSGNTGIIQIQKCLYKCQFSPDIEGHSHLGDALWHEDVSGRRAGEGAQTIVHHHHRQLLLLTLLLSPAQVRLALLCGEMCWLDQNKNKNL